MIQALLTKYRKFKNSDKEKYYYEIITNRYTHWKMLSLIDTKNNTNHYTNHDLKFRGVQYGISAKEFNKVMDYPLSINYSNIELNNSDSKHIILFYKFHIGNIKTNCEVHFLNDEFFMARYFFGDNDHHKTQRIKESFIQKYDLKIINNSATVFNNVNNYINLKDDVELSISFINGDSSIQKVILANIEVENVKKSIDNVKKINSIMNYI